MEHSVLRLSLGNKYKFQGLLHHLLNRYYFTTYLVLPKEKDVL